MNEDDKLYTIRLNIRQTVELSDLPKTLLSNNKILRVIV